MKILPTISQPTLDSFRKDVYRPRLALLLLILLLSGKKQLPTEWLSEKSEDKLSSTTANIIDNHPIQAVSLTSFLSLDKILAPFYSNREKIDVPKRDKSHKEKGKGQKDEATHAEAAKSKSKGKTADDLNSVSVLRIPRLGLQLLLRGEALSAIIPLHILWIVRLAGMMVEDSIVKRLHSQHVFTAHKTVFLRITVLTFLAASSLLLTSSSNLYKTASALSLGWYSPGARKDDTNASLALPFRLIVLLELTATLLSLLSPLMKLNNPILGRHLPRNIDLPSPSHAPSMTDILPLPPGLADILSGRASNMQTRAGRRGFTTLGREPGAGLMRHGAIAAPLNSPAQSSAPSNQTTKKAPRVKGLKVQVDSAWLLENVIVLWGYLVGSVEYSIVALSLPTLSPTSFPPILALLSLRSQLSALVLTWTTARRSVECLEFVRRRWATTSRTTPRWTPDQQAEVLCPVCLEQMSKDDSASVSVESCRLDCGHELHAVCLVQIFLGTKQAFCPCCHDALKATPPSAVNIVPPVEANAPLPDVVQ